MCGIAGIIDLSDRPIDRAVIESMSSAMINRGPDAYGLQAIPHAVLGHRRLSILDLSPKGNQPMSDKERKNWIVYNGEIYNHNEIRQNLKYKGYDYFSRTDTETILYGYKNWGEGISAKLRGMWAFAIWDATASTLLLSRDRFGEKPLFYYQAGSRLAFASTLAGLVPALPNRDINPDAVASLLSYEYIPTNECIYKGVKKLPPACNLTFNEDGLKVEYYWNLDYRNKLDITLGEAVDRVDYLIDSAVQEQLVADVPLGVFLSGGVDSGYISALAAKHKPGITAITMTVPGSKERDESRNARQIVNRHAINGIEVPLGENCIKNLPLLLTTMEPFGDSSIIPVSAVSSEAVKYLKVVLTGDGGDEGFGGYGLPQLAFQGEKLKYGSKLRLLKTISPLLKILSRQRLTPLIRLFRLHSWGANLAAGAGIIPFLQARDAMPSQVSKMVFGSKLHHLRKRPLGKHLVEFLDESLYNDWWEAIFSIGIKGRFVDDFLYKVDSASMYHSLETRAPFLDYRLVEFAAQLPREILIPDGEYKNLLKSAAVRYNPKNVVYGRKKGFSIPVEQYFLGGWGKLLLEMTRDGVAAQMGLLNPAGIKNYLKKHGLRATYRLDRQLFTILALELWLRVFHEHSANPVDLGTEMLSCIKN